MCFFFFNTFLLTNSKGFMVNTILYKRLGSFMNSNPNFSFITSSNACLYSLGTQYLLSLFRLIIFKYIKPSFCGPFVHIVHAVHVKILHMPTKRSKHHTRIHPRRTNSTDCILFASDYLKKWVFGATHVIQVERMWFRIMNIDIIHLFTSPTCGKATTKFRWRKICSIFNYNIFFFD